MPFDQPSPFDQEPEDENEVPFFDSATVWLLLLLLAEVLVGIWFFLAAARQ